MLDLNFGNHFTLGGSNVNNNVFVISNPTFSLLVYSKVN